MNDRTGLHHLIQRIAHGDDATAQAELYSLTYTPLIQYVTARFGSSLSGDDISEIVSQSILQMFLHAAGYRGGNGNSSAWKWAYEIARNQALKWLKTMQRETCLFGASDDDLDLDEAQLHRMIIRYNPNLAPDSVEEQVMKRLLREKMTAILQQLTPREKMVLQLHYEEDMSLKQIAARLRLTPARITQIMQGIIKKCQSAAS